MTQQTLTDFNVKLIDRWNVYKDIEKKHEMILY